jgi:Spy/CpxP family protein refolding chaperone
MILSLVMLMMFGASALLAQQRGRAVMPAGSGPQMGGPGTDAMGPLGPLGQCFRALNLTDAQRADVKALVETEIPVLQALHETVKADEEALKALLEGTAPEPCGVGTAFLEVHADRGAIRAELQSFRTKIEALLTAEQKLRLAGCLDAHGPRP